MNWKSVPVKISSVACPVQDFVVRCNSVSERGGVSARTRGLVLHLAPLILVILHISQLGACGTYTNILWSPLGLESLALVIPAKPALFLALT